MASGECGESGNKFEKSKTLVLTGHGGYDKMKIELRSTQKPSAGEVLVHIKASGINFAELMCRQGTYDRIPKLPAVLGLEAAGEVVQLGADASKFKVGDRVICVKNFGLWMEYACVPETQCFLMPSEMTYEEAAAIPVNYVTAYHMLFEFGNLRRGQSVLIHMAAGGVGTAATQLCRTVPDVTVFGTASAAKHDAIRQIGVSHPIDYRKQDYVREILAISPDGVDIVLDPLSGADSVKGYNLLKPLGKIIHFGAANAVSGPNKSVWSMVRTYMGVKSYNTLSMISHNKAMCGYHMGHLVDRPEVIRSAVESLMTLYTTGKIKPTIDSVWAFEDIGKAMARMHDRLNVGKVIISPQKTRVTEGGD